MTYINEYLAGARNKEPELLNSAGAVGNGSTIDLELACDPGECLIGCVSRCATLRLDADQHLFQEGDAQKFVYRVRDGFIRVYKLFGNGQRRLLQLVAPGEFLGLGLKTNFPFSAQAITAAELCCISKAALQSHAAENAPLTYRLYAALSLELEAAQSFALMVSRRDPQRRLAAFLMMLSDRNKQRGADPEVIFLPMPRRDIADYLGLTNETISRILTKFRKRGLIEINGVRYIHIIDTAILTAMAELF